MKRVFYLCSGIWFLIVGTILEAQTPAFPGAEGFGKYATGGRGGKIYYVTNLNDSGQGSLREAVEASGARTVLFKVSGTIELRSPLQITEPNITIAGQTAPGDGICLRNYTLDIAADNVIIRFIRSRLGDVARHQDDAVHCLKGKNIILDHCSFSWSVDEVASFYDKAESLTVQWCIISESLNNSVHAKGEHGYGGIWGGIRTTFHHNLLAHHTSRNPRFNNGNVHRPTEHIDCVNNVIYNWGFNSAYGGELGKHNLRFNYYKPGPATRKNVRSRIVEPWDTTGLWYVDGNVVEGDSVVSSNNWEGGVQGKYVPYFREHRVQTPFEFAPVTTQKPVDAFHLVLQYAGACVPKRDKVDERILDETKMGTAHFGKQYGGGGKGIIDSQEDVGGWPVLTSVPAPVDSDNDGIPDGWESEHKLNSHNPADAVQPNSDGYTMLEVYLNSLAVKVMP